ncbi:MAG TPA: hypothetical protein VF533_09565 [Solirubrobacteraceae bacterium]
MTLRTPLLTLALTALAAAPAHAATVSRAGDDLTYGSGAAAAKLTVASESGRITFTDAGDVVTPGSGCDRGSHPADLHFASCPAAGVKRVRLAGEDGADAMAVADSVPGSLPFSIAGGPGADTLRGGTARDSLSGDDGADKLFGGASADVLDGGAGDDRFEPDPRTDELAAALYTGDRVSGGAGSDTVAYPDRSTSMKLTLDGRNNDGVMKDLDTTAEFDNIDADRSVENLEPGEGGSFLVLDDKANTVVPGEGSYNGEIHGPWEEPYTFDVDAGGGDDHIETTEWSDRVDGGAGDDYLRDGGGGDLIDGGEGDDVILGTSGGRQGGGATGGPGHDAITGGDFMFSIESRDGEVDDIDCSANDPFPLVADPADVLVGCDPSQPYPAAVSASNAGGLRFLAEAGDANDIAVTQTGAGSFTVTDSQPFEAHNGCTAVSATKATCSTTGGPLSVEAGDGDDAVTVAATRRAVILGASGDDTLTGGDGDDRIDPGDGGDVVSGGKGLDTVTYATRSRGVTVDLDGVRDDGNAKDGALHDNVLADVENLVGGAGSDFLTGSAAANLLEGRAGGDTLTGRGGADTATYAGRWTGVTADNDGVRDDGNGDDGRLPGERDTVRTDVERITGTHGNDTLTAFGPNVVNVLVGGIGADTLKTRDGGGPADQVLCGVGTDRFDTDPADTTDACETAATLP